MRAAAPLEFVTGGGMPQEIFVRAASLEFVTGGGMPQEIFVRVDGSHAT